MKKSRLFEKIFPDDFIDLVNDIGEAYSQNLWSIGYISLIAVKKLNEIKSQIVRREFKGSDTEARVILAYTISDLYMDLARNFGLSRSRLGVIVSVVSYYDEGIIDKYSMLPFSHFAYAKTVDDRAIEILEFDHAQYCRNGNVPPSLEWLIVNFSQYNLDDDLKSHDAIVSLENSHDEIFSDKPSVAGVPSSVFYFVRSAGKLINSIEKGIEKMSLPDDKKEIIFELIERLRELSLIIDGELK